MIRNGRISYSDLDGGLGQGCGPSLMFCMLIGVIVLATLCSCRSIRYVPVETVIHDSIQVERVEYVRDTTKENTVVRDSSWMSIHMADSTELANVGIRLDGVTKAYVIERNKVRELENRLSSAKEKVVYKDSIVYKDREVQVPYPVEKELSRWEKLKSLLGGWAMLVAVLSSVLILLRLLRRPMP